MVVKETRGFVIDVGAFGPGEARRLGERVGPWLVGGGVAQVVLGAIGLFLATVSTLASVIAFGVLLVAGGVVQVVQALRLRAREGLFLYLLIGLVTAFAGVALVLRPGVGALALTLLLAGFFLAAGTVRVVVALLHPMPGRSWAVMNGAITFLLGLLIGAQWPASAFWAIGTIVSVELLVAGGAQIGAGLEVNRLLGRGREPQPGTAGRRRPRSAR
jgi:uncharacterized membrane protein HdeD (DUF308 family)